MTVCEEIQIRAPWGFISGKTWGDKSGIPGLALHGIQDNASTFDLLIPHLPPGFFWVCIDLPGHGRSSHFSYGLPLDFIQYVYSVKFVVDHYGWNRLYVMGHSFGAHLSTFLTALLGDKIVKTILLDGLTNEVVPAAKLVEFYRDRFNKIDNLNKKMETASAPKYPSYEAALDRFKTSRPAKLTDEAANTLIKRSLFPVSDGIRFTSDPRLKFFVKTALTVEQTYQVLNNIKCPLLLVVSNKTVKGIERNPSDVYPTQILVELQKAFPKFTIKIVSGNHDVHMNEPEKIGKLISDFILNTNPKL